MSPGRSSMTDVAARAGVSVATVSRALRGSPLVTPETRDRVVAAAEELSFSVSRAASGLASGRVGRVAVLVSGRLDAWFNGAVLDGLYEGLRDAGQELLIFRVADAAERAEFFRALPVRRNADALVVASFALTAAERRRLSMIGMPLLYLNQRRRGAAGVAIDDVAATRSGVAHLVALGHRWPAFVRVDNRAGFSYSALARLDGYRAELAAAGAGPEDQRVLTAAGFGDGEHVLDQLAADPHRPTALMAESDELAMSVVAAATRRGLGVPAELSVLGFDDHQLAGTYGLSTIAQPVTELGRTAAAMALTLAADRALERRQVVLPTRLVLRRTTAAPPASLR
jgi:LacI family transcriptional regulator, repressor for deo operon, udp, cdd, tsx, nupC, and nupG